MEGNPSSDEHTITLRLKDRLLLCSDGLTGMLTDEQIKHLLGENPEPEAACQALISAANAAGGKDNVTALVLNCG